MREKIEELCTSLADAQAAGELPEFRLMINLSAHRTHQMVTGLLLKVMRSESWQHKKLHATLVQLL